ncbi:MAG: ribose-5-phosphate isomerase RpiA [Candidatus Hadarchaeales archaeon]
MEESWKKFAAERVCDFVEEGMVVGLGSGTTVQRVIESLARRKLKTRFVPASNATENLARKLGLTLTSLTESPELDLVIDGADEVDPDFNALKGRGGALTREKILCHAAKKVVFAVDRTKLVRRLGKPVPVEVLPFSLGFVRRKLQLLGGDPELRMVSGTPYLTDNQNFILDVRFRQVRPMLERKINEIPGVVENGIFPKLADLLVVGWEGGAEIINNRKKFMTFLRGVSTANAKFSQK